MKKLNLLLVVAIALSLTGCSKEQEAQIYTYWGRQFQLFAKRLGISQQDMSQFLQSRAHGRAGVLSPQQQEELQRAFEQINEQSAGNNDNAAAKPVTKKAQPIQASLFLSPTCPWCQRVQKEGFARKFREKYDGQIILTEYMLNNDTNMAFYSKTIKKHNLSGGVPLLIIGNTPIQGYSEKLLEQASAVAEKEIKKHNLESALTAAQKTPPVLQVSMEDEEIHGAASTEDKKKMKRMLLSLQEANGETIQSIGTTFGPVVRNQAMAIAAKTEKKLKSIADQSADIASFTAQYNQIVEQHNQEMDQLMRKNADKIRNVR